MADFLLVMRWTRTADQTIVHHTRQYEKQGDQSLEQGGKLLLLFYFIRLKLIAQKIRQSWSKYNLYNLQRFRNPNTANRTFFQQKWSAKSAARAYHGEQVPETQWERMFSRRIRSVVPMDAARLAEDDGSKMSAGRGSGLQSPAEMENLGAKGQQKSTSQQLTPYMQMAFAPLERRLDTAIFRALFASSTRQARQFVVHGAVTVNGKQVRNLCLYLSIS